MFKDIISNQEGQNLFPGLPTYIKGAPGVTPITMENTKPQIALTKYGATQMMPGMEYAFPGNGVLEIPIKQMGGSQEDQIMQFIIAFAKKKQKDPNELIAQIQQLPKDQQAKAIQAIMQDVQQDQGMTMAKDGGCIDCQEAYPQAQNLNWFYKAQGGTAFPAANMYPESWAGYNGNQYDNGGNTNISSITNQYTGQKGNIFENAITDDTGFRQYNRQVTPGSLVEFAGDSDKNQLRVNQSYMNDPFMKDYLYKKAAMMTGMKGGGEPYPQAAEFPPYTQGVETRANFMAEYGGQSLDQIYQRMKAGGLNFDAKKKRGGELSKETFAQYVQRNGGNLPKHQLQGQTYSWTPQSAFQGANQFMPQPIVEQNAQQQGWENFNRSYPMQPTESYLGNNQTTTAAGDAVSFKPGSTADPANPNYQQPAGAESITDKPKKIRGDIEGSAYAVATLGAIGSAIEGFNAGKERKKTEGRINTTDIAYQPVKDVDRGDYLANVTQGTAFRPNEMQYKQKGIGPTESGQLWNNPSAPRRMHTQMGGDIMNMLQDGAEIDLDMYDEDTQNRILQAIYAMGGSIEYI